MFPSIGNGAISPSSTITGSNTLLAAALGIAIDGAGNTWVANTSTPSLPVLNISEYAAGSNGNVAPIAQLFIPGANLNAITLDSSGNIYVAGGFSNAVYVFPAGSSGTPTASRIIQGSATNIVSPSGISVDSSGNIWVSMSTSLVEFAAGANGNVAPIADITGSNTLLNNVKGITTDSSGHIIVANSGSSTISVFAAGSNGNVAPLHSLGGGSSGLATPNGIAFDAAGYLYVSNSGNGSITVYSPTDLSGSGTPSQTITTHLCFGGIAVK